MVFLTFVSVFSLIEDIEQKTRDVCLRGGLTTGWLQGGWQREPVEAMKTHPWSGRALKLLLEEKLLSGLCSQESCWKPSPGQGCPGTSSAIHHRLQEQLTGGQYLIRSWQTSRCKGKGLGFLGPGSWWERCGNSHWGCNSHCLFLCWISTGPVPDLPSCSYSCRSQKLPIVKAQLVF